MRNWFAVAVLPLVACTQQAVTGPEAVPRSPLANAVIANEPYSASALPFRAVGIDDGGTIVGVHTTASGSSLGVSWRGAMTPLPPMPRDLVTIFYEPKAVAPSGLIVGYRGKGVVQWASSSAPPVLLAGIGYTAQIRAVNSGGVVVGAHNGRPFRYHSSTGLVYLAGPTGTAGAAYGISENGWVSGYFLPTGSTTPWAVKWSPSGQPTVLQPNGLAADMLSDGTAVGAIQLYGANVPAWIRPPYGRPAVRWDPTGAGVDVGPGLPNPTNASAAMVISARRMAGSWNIDGPNDEDLPWTQSALGVTWLVKPTGYARINGLFMNECGTIVGWGDGANHSVVWTPSVCDGA